MADPSSLLTTGINVVKIANENKGPIFQWVSKFKLNLLPANFNIGISLDFNQGLKSGTFFSQIKKNIIKELDNSGLNENIKIQDISSLKKFSSKAEAEKFAIKKKINLIVWGDITEDGLKEHGKDVYGIDLNFSFILPTDPKKILNQMLKQDVASRFANRIPVKITPEDSFRDVKIISEQIFDLSIYIIALVFKISGRVGEATVLFSKLYENLNRRQDEGLRIKIVPHLINCYELLVIFFINTKSDWQKVLEFSSEILELDNRNLFGLSNLAMAFYKMGKMEESEKVVSDMLIKYPRAPITELDMAFFKIMSKEYKSAFRHYERLIECDPKVLTFEPNVAVEFLAEEYDKTHESALLFGSGLVSYHFGDKNLAQVELRNFLTKFEPNLCIEMYRKAKNLLKI